MNQYIRKRATTNFLILLIGIISIFSFANPCSAQDKKTAETYKALIKQGDKAFAAQDFKGALLWYEKAHEAKPEYNYATNKIDEITKILDSGSDSKIQTALNNKNISTYKSLVAQADYAFDAKEYADALLFYEKAFETRPDYNYAPEKIDEIHSILAATPDSKVQLYENTIRKAESFYAQKKYQPAKSEFQKAALIDSSAKLPKERLEQISSNYIDTNDMTNFNLAISSGDKELAISDFDHAVLFYEAALKLHPSSKFLIKKIDDTKKQQSAYIVQKKQKAVISTTADNIAKSEKPAVVRTENKKTSPIAPDNQIVQEISTDAVSNANTDKLIPARSDKTLEQADQLKYDIALANAESLLKSADYEGALTGFKTALTIKPAEIYPKQKISEVEGKLGELKNRDKNYALAIDASDRLLSESKYNEALNSYKQAITIKPNESYPIGRITEINSILANQKSESDNYAQALRTGEKALAARDYSLALASFQDARKIKPSEIYPLEQISEINTITSNQQKNDEKYATAIKTGDQLFESKEYNGAFIAYSEASELNKSEKYPQVQISKINKILGDSRSVDENYTIDITEGDRLFGMKDYVGANLAFSKATLSKPAETYPKQRITEINKIIEETAKARSSEYNKALEVADKLYKTKVFDQAIDAYDAAAKLNPGDAYPEQQILAIKKYLSDHAILNLYSQVLVISKGNDKQFNFDAIDPSLRKNNYILLNARSTGKTIPKVYLDYGKDSQKNGGIVLRNLDKSTLKDFLISISIQDKWFREENNWIRIVVETGEIEITKVQIAAGE